MTPRRDAAAAANTVDDSHHEILDEYDDRHFERMAKRAAKEAGGKYITWRILSIGIDEEVRDSAGQILGTARIAAVYLRSVYRLAGAGVDNTDIRLA